MPDNYEQPLSLVRSQKNDVFNKIRETGLNPADFRWETVASKFIQQQHVERLIHVPTGSYFHFDFNLHNKHCSEFSPGLDQVVAPQLIVV